MQIEEIELVETMFRTRAKFMKTGNRRLNHLLINANKLTAMEVLQSICANVDCNFHEVLDAVNRTVR